MSQARPAVAAINRSIHVSTGMAPQFVLAGIAASISISFNILLPVVPVVAERAGPHGAAGAATAALFAGAVAGELLTPWLLSRWSSRRLLAGGQLMTAVPSLVFLVPHPGVWLMLAATAARGLGMGVAIVVAVVLVDELTTPGRRGRNIGYFGLALTAPGIVVPSVGVTLLAAGRPDADALIAFAIGLVGALLVLRLPVRVTAVGGASSNLIAALRTPGLLLLFIGFVLVSCGWGAVITFVPIALPAGGVGSAAAFLFVSGVARAASRWYAGVLGDRRPGRLVLIGGVGLTFLGLVALAAGGSPVVVIFAALAFGAGFGAVQTAIYLVMTVRGSSSHRHAVSALWNSGIDLGASLGGTLLGLAAAHYGYASAIWAIPAVVLVAVPLILLPAAPVSQSRSAGPGEPSVEPAGAIGP